GQIEFEGRTIAGAPAYAIVRKGLALSPEGWRLFVQQSVEKNLLLGATPVADKARILSLLQPVYALFPRLAEQSVDLALEVASYAYVLQVGRSVLSGPARELINNPDVQRIYLGVG
ncbi:MAG TPA: ABC transporter ATP-binding protein, partial [Hyphomicrobiaceae bacterium]|nr:ABC transporter ATP-binding protein [Hyphomicrobiaceae bacterium]